MNFLYVGIDDTDSPDGMCTTFLASTIINELNKNNIEITGFPRLIRLNPFARFKTRGNGGVSFKIAINSDNDIDLAKEIILRNVSELSMFDCDNTNPGVVFYQGDITDEMVDYAFHAIYDIITIEEAEEFASKIGAEIHKFKKGRGIIGSIAAISCPLDDYTYELLAYRHKDKYGTVRQIDYDSVVKMDKETYPETFENIDGKYLAIEPKTPCPVLYGIRSNSPEVLDIARDIVIPNEEIVDYCIFKTNQHTDMHIQNVDNISDMKQYACYKVKGTLIDNPHVIGGGHMFFTLADDSGEIECAAYEPTKNFRKTVAKLRKGDSLELYGGIGEQNTFNIEKFQVLKLNDVIYENPICKCGKRMTSAGKGKGFKCKNCGAKITDDNKVAKKINRELINGKFYETPVSARRHLSKPLIRMDLNKY
ncbi:MAG: tRNA(Ile)(2)-agmatinylcytidine synthase [archaeon]|nr:tRNA(Ile)(2)-agmatinylcytidine synthase [archaeon]